MKIAHPHDPEAQEKEEIIDTYFNFFSDIETTENYDQLQFAFGYIIQQVNLQKQENYRKLKIQYLQ